MNLLLTSEKLEQLFPEGGLDKKKPINGISDSYNVVKPTNTNRRLKVYNALFLCTLVLISEHNLRLAKVKVQGY